LKLKFSATLSWPGKKRNGMKALKFTQAQKGFTLKKGEQGTPVLKICRKAGISQTTYFNWKKKYAGLLPDKIRRLKAPEDENARLEHIAFNRFCILRVPAMAPS
jgi:putative transposase